MAGQAVDKDVVDQIRASIDAGHIEKVVVDQHGRIISGNHRLAADPNWPKAVIQVKDDEDYLLKKHAAKIQRLVSEEERKRDLLDLAKELEKKGVSKENICSEISRKEPWISSERIRQLLPPEYKQVARAEAGRKGAEATHFAKTVLAKLDTAEDIVREMVSLRDEERWYGHLSRPLMDKVGVTLHHRIERAVKDDQPLEEVLKILDMNVGYAPTQSDQTKKGAHTDPQMILGAELQRRKIPIKYEVPYIRPEKTEDGKPKSYIVDILADDSLAVEVEGDGSASSNDPERDQFLEKQGLQIFHVSNEEALKNTSQVADKVQSLLGIEPPITTPDQFRKVVEEAPVQEPVFKCPHCGADITSCITKMVTKKFAQKQNTHLTNSSQE